MKKGSDELVGDIIVCKNDIIYENNDTNYGLDYDGI